MSKVKFIKLEDKSYPLVFSLNVASKLVALCGGLKKMEKFLELLKKEEMGMEGISIMKKLTSFMMQEGALYLDTFGSSVFEPENIALDEDGKHQYLTPNQVTMLISSESEIMFLIKKIEEVISSSNRPQIQVKNAKKKKFHRKIYTHS